MPVYAFGVFGPPGSGKSSFCREIVALMKSMERKVKLIDLDPANEVPCYVSDASIQDLIKTDDVMKKEGLGLNGALMHCMNYLEEHKDWLLDKIKSYENNTFVVMDLPGQVELFTHNTALKNIFESFGDHGIQMSTAYLVDSFCCSDPGMFISFLITTLMSMVHIELPRLNILSKVDLIPRNEEQLDFGLDFYTNVLDLDRLVARLDDDDVTGKYKKLTKAIAGVIERYGLVKFIPVSLSDKASLVLALKLIDQGAGYLGSENVNVFASCASDLDDEIEKVIGLLNEKYVVTPKEVTPPIGVECVIRETEYFGTPLPLVENGKLLPRPGPI